MVMIGVDAHKRTHTFVAMDDAGRKLGECTLAATPDGHLEALQWAAHWQAHQFAVEDCRHVTRCLERDLLRAGEAVVRVPAQLTAEQRRGGRERGKSDPIDALAVARAALREPGLPVAQLDGASREVRLLVDHREDLVAERTRIQCRLRWHLHELFPGMEIAKLVHDLAPTLMELAGCGPLSAAKIVGETAGVQRFRTKAAFASWNGTAPVPVWSGKTPRYRLSRSGNRQVNAALHRIAITQWRSASAGHVYVARRIAAGTTRTEGCVPSSV